jgi:small-conductance mechanosensitive channel
MEKRRILFSLGVTYQATPEQLKIIPELIKSTIEAQENVTFDRAHFANYGDFSLNFEVVYYVESREYNVFMDINQNINLKLFEAFANKGIEFAYPTQTLFLNKES